MAPHVPDRRTTAAQVHHPIPLASEQHAAPLTPRTDGIPDVTTVQLPDGRIVTGYTLTPAQPPAPTPRRVTVHPTAVNIAIGGIGFTAICGGLLLLTGFITAIAALIHQLIILAAIVFGLFIAAQLYSGGDRGGTTVNCRKAVFKNNHFRG
ncbi:hypothetical protein [Streptomyces sp. CT34]|uniref:hypothetical protein n=1 Tax=Streptomyces sp. CT34 TaxID=1553907 RepID=UPI0005BD7197|nr:hypothetical protein [Streptomyces sp. CT34]